jgi:four helix bundle protein
LYGFLLSSHWLGPCVLTQLWGMKEYNLEVRTEQFANSCRAFIRKIDKDLSNTEDCKQLARASGSTAANCIEANEGFSKKDRVFRFKICRKESKESRLFLRLTECRAEVVKERELLVDEATQLVRIFSTIIGKLGEGDREG